MLWLINLGFAASGVVAVVPPPPPVIPMTEEQTRMAREYAGLVPAAGVCPNPLSPNGILFDPVHTCVNGRTHAHNWLDVVKPNVFIPGKDR